MPGLVVHVAQQKTADQRILRCVVHKPVAHQMPEVTQGLMAGVQQPELHQFVRSHVGDHLHTDRLESRTAGRERVLENPLGERFGDHGPPVRDAGARLHLIAEFGWRGRGDSVDHRVRESCVVADPLGQTGVLAARKGDEGLACDVPVALDVVARHHRERGVPGVATTTEGLDDEAERRRRNSTRLEIGLDRRVGQIEFPCRGREVVSALGDGERHDSGGRVGELVDHRCRVVGCEQILGDGADNRGLHGPVGMLESQRIEPILRYQRIPHVHITR